MDDLKYLKMHYGEDFARLCRTLFPTILKNEGKLTSIIESKFAHSKFLANDLKGMEKEFKDYIYEIYEKDYKKVIFKLTKKKTPEELMDEAGYILYPECKTEADIQKFRKYWFRRDGRTFNYKGGKPHQTRDDELCTFDGGRLDICRVWFAIRKDIDKIKRDDYKVEKENEYDLSALSIQFDKFGMPNLSIKGRYNHAVPHPDATLNNNLDNIIPGLSEAFGIMNNVPLVKFKPKNYVMAEDGKYYRYFGFNYSTYFCENGYIIDEGKKIQFDPDRFIVCNNGFVFDSKDKQITAVYSFYTNKDGQCEMILDDDGFINTYKDITKIEFEKGTKGGRKIIISQKDKNPVIIETDKEHSIIGIDDPSTVILPENYANKISSLKSIKMDNLKLINDGCFEFAPNIEHLSFPNLQRINDNCFRWSNSLKTFEANNLKIIGDDCFVWLNELKKFDAINLKKIGMNCFFSINDRTIFDTPKLKSVAFGCFAGYNENIRKHKEALSQENLTHEREK